jgi:hypothetical protein
VNAVIKPFHIHPQHAIKVALDCVLCVPDVRDSGVVYQDGNVIVANNFRKPGDDLGLVSNITRVGRCSSSRAADLSRNGFSVLWADIKNVHSRAICRELVSNRPANPTPAARHDCRLPVEAKLARASIFAGQRETPCFQGMKSS